MSNKVTARFILEVAGKPQENVDKALNLVEKRLKEDKKFKVKDSEVVESEYDEEMKIYSGFIDTGIKFKETKDVLGFIMDYTPTSVEIEDPQKIQFSAAELTEVLNDMSRVMLRAHSEIRALRGHIHVMNEKFGIKPKPKKTTKKK